MIKQIVKGSLNPTFSYTVPLTGPAGISSL